MRKKKQQNSQKQIAEATPSQDDDATTTDSGRSTRSTPLKDKDMLAESQPASTAATNRNNKSKVLFKSIRRKTQRVVSKIAESLRNKKPVAGAATSEGVKSQSEEKDTNDTDKEQNGSKKEQSKKGFFRKTMSFRKSKRHVEKIDAKTQEVKCDILLKTAESTERIDTSKDLTEQVLSATNKTDIPASSEAVVLVAPSTTTIVQPEISKPVSSAPITTITQSLTIITVSAAESHVSSTPALQSPLTSILVSPSPSVSSIPQTPSPGMKRRPRKLNDCIAMLTGKLTEKLGVPFLETEPITIPKPIAPTVLNVPSIPKVQAFLKSHEPLPVKSVTRTTLTIPTYPAPSPAPSPAPHVPVVDQSLADADDMTPVDLSIPKGTFRNDPPTPSPINLSPINLSPTPPKRRTPRKPRNQRSNSIGSYQELIIPTPSPNKHIPVVARPLATPVRDTISEVIFAVSRGEDAQETAHVPQQLAPFVPHLEADTLLSSTVAPLLAPLVPVLPSDAPLCAPVAPLLPPVVPLLVPVAPLLAPIAPLLAPTAPLFDSIPPLLPTATPLLVPIPPLVQPVVNPLDVCETDLIPVFRIPTGFEHPLPPLPTTTTDIVPAITIPTPPAPSPTPSETFGSRIKLKPMSELLAPALPAKNTRSRRSAKKAPKIDVELLNRSEADTSLVISTPCLGDEDNEIPIESTNQQSDLFEAVSDVINTIEVAVPLIEPAQPVLVGVESNAEPTSFIDIPIELPIVETVIAPEAVSVPETAVPKNTRHTRSVARSSGGTTPVPTDVAREVLESPATPGSSQLQKSTTKSTKKATAKLAKTTENYTTDSNCHLEPAATRETPIDVAREVLETPTSPVFSLLQRSASKSTKKATAKLAKTTEIYATETNCQQEPAATLETAIDVAREVLESQTTHVSSQLQKSTTKSTKKATAKTSENDANESNLQQEPTANLETPIDSTESSSVISSLRSKDANTLPTPTSTNPTIATKPKNSSAKKKSQTAEFEKARPKRGNLETATEPSATLETELSKSPESSNTKLKTAKLLIVDCMKDSLQRTRNDSSETTPVEARPPAKSKPTKNTSVFRQEEVVANPIDLLSVTVTESPTILPNETSVNIQVSPPEQSDQLVIGKKPKSATPKRDLSKRKSGKNTPINLSAEVLQVIPPEPQVERNEPLAPPTESPSKCIEAISPITLTAELLAPSTESLSKVIESVSPATLTAKPLTAPEVSGPKESSSATKKFLARRPRSTILKPNRISEPTKAKTSSSKKSKKADSEPETSTNPFDSGDEEFHPWDPEIGLIKSTTTLDTSVPPPAEDYSTTPIAPIPSQTVSESITSELPATSDPQPPTPPSACPSPIPASKQRKRRKNELAKIIADQLLESFKQVDQSRIGELKMLHDISIDSSSDDTLLRTTMSYTPPPKRKSASKVSDELATAVDLKGSESDASTSTGKKKGKQPTPTAQKSIKSILSLDDKSGKSEKKKRGGIRFNLDPEKDGGGHQSDTEVAPPKPAAKIKSRRQTICADRVDPPSAPFVELAPKTNKKRGLAKSSSLVEPIATIKATPPLRIPTSSVITEKSTPEVVYSLKLDTKIPKKIRASRRSIDMEFPLRLKRIHKSKLALDPKTKPKKPMVSNDMVAQIISDFTTSTIDSRNNSPIVFVDPLAASSTAKTANTLVNGFDGLVKPKNRALELLRNTDKLGNMKSPLRAPFMSPRWEADEVNTNATNIQEKAIDPIASWHTLPTSSLMDEPSQEKGLIKSLKNKTKSLLGISKKKSKRLGPKTKAPAPAPVEAVKRPLLRPSILNGSLNLGQSDNSNNEEVLRKLESNNLFLEKDNSFENEPVPNIFAPVEKIIQTAKSFNFDAVKASAVTVRGAEVKSVVAIPKDSTKAAVNVSQVIVMEPIAKPIRKLGSIKTRPTRNTTPVQKEIVVPAAPSVGDSLNTGFLSDTLLSNKSVQISSAPTQLSAGNQELVSFDCSQDTVLSAIVNKIQAGDQADSDEDLCLSEIAKNLNSKLMTTDEFNEEVSPSAEDQTPVFKVPSDFEALRVDACASQVIATTEPDDIPSQSASSTDCLDVDENTNNELVDMDLEDTMSVYTSFSMDTSVTTSGKKKKRRSRKSIISKTSRKARRAEDQFLSPSTFHCEICDKTFSSQSALTSHKSTLKHISKLSEQEFLQSKESLQSDTIETPPEQNNIDTPDANAELPCGSETYTKPAQTTPPRLPPVPEVLPENPKTTSLPSTLRPTLDSSPVRIPPPPTTNTYRPSGIEPISSPEQNNSERYNVHSRLGLPMLGSPRQVLSQEERLFYECCSMLKGSERRVSDSPPTYYQLPRIHSSELIMANNKPVTPRSNEQYSYVVPEGSKGKGTPKIDLNQFSDISSDSNPAYSCPQIPSSSETQHIFARQPKAHGIFSNSYASSAAQSSFGSREPGSQHMYLTNTSAAMENLAPSKNHVTDEFVPTKYSDICDSFQSSQDAIENVEHFGRLDSNTANNASFASADGTANRLDGKTLSFERILEQNSRKAMHNLPSTQEPNTNCSSRSVFLY